jgi:hypothetical protein
MSFNLKYKITSEELSSNELKISVYYDHANTTGNEAWSGDDPYDWESGASVSKGISTIPINFKTSLIKDVTSFIYNGREYLVGNQYYGIEQQTYGVKMIENGAKIGTRIFASGGSYFYKNPISNSSNTFAAKFNLALGTEPSDSDWFVGYFSDTAFAPAWNGGQPLLNHDETPATAGSYASVYPVFWPRTADNGNEIGTGLHKIVEYKVVLKDGVAMPTNLSEIFYWMRPPSLDNEDSDSQSVTEADVTYYLSSTTPSYYYSFRSNTSGAYLTSGTMVVSGYDMAAGAPAGESGGESSGSYDWTHEGQLTNIVKFVRGQDLNGNPSYAYAKKEDDNTTTLYFTPDLTNFAAFNSYDSGASSIDGSPIFIEYGAGGKVLVGTDTGKVYQIELDEYSVPQSYALLHDVVGGHPVNSLKYGYAMNQWIFEAGGDIYTIPAAGGGAVLRHSLPAGAKVIDFAEGDEGKVAFIVRMADFSIEPRMAPADWSVIYGPSSMVVDASVATDFNYSHAMDLWVSSNADGSSIVTVSDLLDYLS